MAGGSIGLPVAFLAGVVSFLSPCVLPLVPGYLSYIAGSNVEAEGSRRTVRRSVALSVCFALGFSTVFTILGASATGLGRLLLSYKSQAEIVGGAIIVVFGLFATGLVRFPWLLREFRLHPQLSGGTPLAAYVLGVAFAFGWTPCIGPVLGAILTVTAVSVSASGILLLAVYSLGLGLPFILSAAFADRIMAATGKLGRTGYIIHVVTGGIMIAMGLAVMTGRLADIAVWLLDEFPVLARIG